MVHRKINHQKMLVVAVAVHVKLLLYRSLHGRYNNGYTTVQIRFAEAGPQVR